MTMLAEKIAVTAKEFLDEKNINDSKEFNDNFTLTKLIEYDWDLSFAAESLTVEIIWKIAYSRNLREWRMLDRLFSPSPIATHCNFRGCRFFKTGEVPEIGATAVWRQGNSWKGKMGTVVEVSENKREFSTIEGRVLNGSDNKFIQVGKHDGRKTGQEFKKDKLNLIGFIYPTHREL